MLSLIVIYYLFASLSVLLFSALSLEWLFAVILHRHTAIAPPSSSQYSEQSASVDEHAASHRRHPAPSGHIHRHHPLS